MQWRRLMICWEPLNVCDVFTGSRNGRSWPIYIHAAWHSGQVGFTVRLLRSAVRQASNDDKKSKEKERLTCDLQLLRIHPPTAAWFAGPMGVQKAKVRREPACVCLHREARGLR
jgi:hypothetical protein